MQAGRDGFKLFVGSLPPDISQEELQAVFSTYGEVTHIHIMNKNQNVSGHASAFVAYAKQESAQDAISVLNGIYKIREGENVQPVKVSFANPAGSGKGAWGKGDYDQGWGKGDFGKGKGYDPWGGWGGWDMGKGKGWDAWGYGWDKGKGKGWDMGGKGWDMGGKGKGGGGGYAAPVAGNRLFIGNLPLDTDEGALRYVFANYGTVDKIHIMTGRSVSGQACAFVEYSTAPEAETAISTLHEKYEIRPGDGPIIVKYANGPGGGKGSAPY